MVNISVSYAEMNQAAKDLGSGREEIAARLQSLQVKMTQLVNSGFVTDQASAKFEAAYLAYSQSAKNVIEKISEIESFLTQTASSIAEFDQQIASKIHH